MILAAGEGTRMRSSRHKVVHPLAGKPLLAHVLGLADGAGAAPPVVVLGHLAEQVQPLLPDGAEIVIQEERLGTGHAVQIAADVLRRRATDRILVLYGDTALVRAGSLQRLLSLDVGPGQPLALLTARLPDPSGYGRVIRAGDGTVDALVEEAEATPDQRRIDEVHSGIMLLWAPWLWEHLWKLPRRSKGEYYLTDLVNLARAEGAPVRAVQAEDATEVHGVNDRSQLAQAHQIAWERKRAALMAAGVTLLDPSTTYVDADVEIGADTVVHPGCHLRGRTRIGRGCEIGPNAFVSDSTVGDECRVWYSVIEEGVTLERRVQVGPFSHLRGRAHLGEETHIGNYAEVNRSQLGAGTKMHHVGYLGDATVGGETNIGAGTITANYDGVNKHPTRIGRRAFVGSNSTLRAPVTIGDNAYTGSGSVVTHDVPAGETWVGVPARPFQRKARPNGTENDRPNEREQ